MRKIKFRAKRLDTGRFIEGHYVSYSGSDDLTSHLIYSSNGNPNDVDPITLGQFTGLEDKNGKEIYEGDLLGEKEKAKVGFDRGSFVVRGYPISEWLSKMELRQIDINVCGNIYENPNLIDNKNG